MEFDDQYRPSEVESTVEEHWESVNAYERTKEATADGPDYYFLDGPPYASGQTHLGTGWNKVLKDLMIRYLRMNGYDVTDRPGYDMHGLPIETKVEEELGFHNKTDIIEYGVEEFIEKCKEFSDRNLDTMQSDFQVLGVWMDWDDPYKTPTNEYIEAAWWSLKRIDENGLVEPSDRVINWCPRCQTALADAEVEYDDVESPSIYVRFPLVDDDASLVIWTTTPWTIPANEYVAADGDLEYARVRAVRGGESEELIVAEECIEGVLGAGRYDDYEVLETFPGSDLVGTRYEHPLADRIPRQRQLDEREGVHRVYATDFVTANRTGLVHSAPGHGEEDYEFGAERDLPAFSPVEDDGTFGEDAGAYAGLEITQGEETDSANAAILEDLEASRALLAAETHEHRYGHCWRCDSPIVLRATNQWFIRITEKQDELIEQMEASEWYPQWARDNRFRNWVEGARDWCFSRQRYWGIPIPIWVPEDGSTDDFLVVASRHELSERADQDIDVDDIDLHRPVVDGITITEDGTTYRRVEDIFDVWFESGVAHLASIGFPEDEEAFEELWPADLIIEAHDQTRGWFWSQLEIGVAAFDQVPYEQVLMHGFLNDAESEKMSKSVGNIVEPKAAVERHGVDATRLYLLEHSPKGVDFDFSWDGMAEQQRRLNIVWNTLQFADQYMSMDGFDPSTATVADADLEPIDRWLLSRLQSIEREVEADFEEFDLHTAIARVVDFLTEDVSRFYIKAIRERVWEEADSASKRAAYTSLATVLLESARLLAPFVPYTAEVVYQQLDGSEPTVHMLSWPEADDALADPELEAHVEVVREIEEAAARARQQAGRGLRWPIRRVVVSADDETAADAVAALESLVAERVNARRVELVEGEWDELEWLADPQMDALGPEYGAAAADVADALEGVSKSELEAASMRIDVDGESYEIDEEMVEFERDTPEDVVGEQFDGGWVYVDVTLTDDIESEGYTNEIVRRVQQLRKELDLEHDTEIDLAVDVGDDRVRTLVDDRVEYIKAETRARDVVEDLSDGTAASAEEEIHGVEISVAVQARD